MKVTYLYHSGFAVDTGRHLLVFDYYKDTPHGGGLSAGTVNEADVRGKTVIVFASHRHHDHMNPCIFDWKQWNPSIQYVLSDDISTEEIGCLSISPRKTYTLLASGNGEEITIQTFRSTDEGVAFLVEVDGKTIYHAGDLNWWHWEGEPSPWNENMERHYCREIDLLKGRQIDLAFVPVDPRLQKQALWGMDYFMRTVGADIAVPMHFWEEPEVLKLLEMTDYGSHIRALTERGESFEMN